MDAAAIVRRIRALNGITRKELAELAGISPSTIGRIERGILDPTWGTLSRILSSTGSQLSGESVVSVGDPHAIAAARPVLESVLLPARERALDPSPPALTGPLAEWQQRWQRAGWVSEHSDADDLVTMAVSAGNAAKLARRKVPRRYVLAEDGWLNLARRLGRAGLEYAVSGLVAARSDRGTSPATWPVIYVRDPVDAVERLGLDESRPGWGVLLIMSTSGELERTEVDNGVRFVSPAQGVLDAFAGSGREPDKAESELRRMLAASA